MTAGVLLTRYNLPSGSQVENRIRAADDWLAHRTELFERYTVPSVRAQTLADRHWIVYLDPDSPDWLKQKMARYASDGLLTPIFRPAVSRDELRADVATVLPPGTGRVVTANLDNDDAIAPDFLQRLADLETRGDRTALYLARGLIRTPDRLYLRTDRSSAFCAVSEVWGPDFVSCWVDWHINLHKHMPVVREAGEPAWLQVVHQRNVSNRARGRLVSPSRYRGVFGAPLDDLPEPSRGEILRQTLVSYPARTVVDAARRLCKGAVLAVLGKEGLDRVKNALSRPGSAAAA